LAAWLNAAVQIVGEEGVEGGDILLFLPQQVIIIIIVIITIFINIAIIIIVTIVKQLGNNVVVL
jgi:hypothetical protein